MPKNYPIFVVDVRQAARMYDYIKNKAAKTKRKKKPSMLGIYCDRRLLRWALRYPRVPRFFTLLPRFGS